MPLAPCCTSLISPRNSRGSNNRCKQEAQASKELRKAKKNGKARPGTGIVSIAELEKQAILDGLHRVDGDKLAAARLLGIGKSTLYRKLKKYGVGEAGDGMGSFRMDG